MSYVVKSTEKTRKSGADTYSDKLWDLQSKGATGNSPKAIGKELVTLFKNYLSDFEFSDFISKK